jgi:hypothetical protein
MQRNTEVRHTFYPTALRLLQQYRTGIVKALHATSTLNTAHENHKQGITQLYADHDEIKERLLAVDREIEYLETL